MTKLTCKSKSESSIYFIYGAAAWNAVDGELCVGFTCLHQREGGDVQHEKFNSICGVCPTGTPHGTPHASVL